MIATRLDLARGDGKTLTLGLQRSTDEGPLFAVDVDGADSHVVHLGALTVDELAELTEFLHRLTDAVSSTRVSATLRRADDIDVQVAEQGGPPPAATLS